MGNPVRADAPSVTPPRSGVRGLLARAFAACRATPPWVLGIVVALLTWNVYFGLPSAGLDPSWHSGLYMATHDGLSFGTEIVFTYGPLGFLDSAYLWYGDLAVIAFAYSAILYVAVACSLVWALRFTLGVWLAAFATFVVLALLSSLEAPLLLALIWCMAALRPDPPRFATAVVAIGGGALAAIETLSKLSVGPPILVLCLIALVGARAGRGRVAAFLGVFATVAVTLWVATGQNVGDLPAYASNGRQVISGYSEAMGVANGPSWQVPAAFTALSVLVAGAAFAPYRDRLARLSGVTIAALAGFAIFKEGVVRFDGGHMAICLATLAAFWFAVPWSPSRRPLFAAGAVLLAGIAVYANPVGGDRFARLHVVDNLTVGKDQAKLLFDPRLRADSAEYARSFMVDIYDLDPATLSLLEGRSVAIDPWETAVVWTYDLEWSPLPVFQNYQAYTDELDALNADELSSSSGPERILRENPAVTFGNDQATRSIDGRYPAWDPPKQALATLCNYAPLRTTAHWQVLGRVEDRCGPERPLGTVESSFGESVSVPEPAPGEVVLARIGGAEVDGLERLRTMLYRASPRQGEVNGTASYRLVPDTADGGLLLRGSPRITGIGAFAQAPQAETLELQGVEGNLTFEFYAIPVTPAGAEQVSDATQ